MPAAGINNTPGADCGGIAAALDRAVEISGSVDGQAVKGMNPIRAAGAACQNRGRCSP